MGCFGSACDSGPDAVDDTSGLLQQEVASN